MATQTLTINPPPSQFTNLDEKTLPNYLSELYKNTYGVWERTGGHVSNIASSNIDLNAKSNITATSTLLQFTLTQNLLNKYVLIDAFGNFAANANNKRLVLYFGNTIVLDTTSLSINGGSWSINAQIYRIDATHQVFKAISFASNNVTANKLFVGDSIENLNSDVIIKMVSTGVAQNDITKKGLIINYI